MLFTVVFLSCSQTNQNPFFTEWKTPFGTPPFNMIDEKTHYLPAFTEGMAQQQKEIDIIVNNAEVPTFTNTIEAMENSGKLLTKVSNVFYNMLSANTSDTLQGTAKQVAPLLSKHHDDILLNEKLFQRVKVIYEQKQNLNLTAEQNRLLEKYYKDFVRGGANLAEEQKAKLREINKELSLLSLSFGENVLKETNKFKLVIDNKEDLAGLPEKSS